MKRELVLLHGWGFNSSVWKSFIPYLNTQYRITPLDLLGFGKNSTTEPLTLNSMTQHVIENTNKETVFLGWSLGGLIAMNIAIHCPEQVSRLITIASTPKFVAENNWPGMEDKALNQFHASLKKDYQATLQEFTLLQFYGSDTPRAIIKTLKKQVAEKMPPIEQNLYHALNILKETDLRDQLNKIQCPHLSLLGRCDTLVPATLANSIKTFNENIKTKVLPKVSHAPFLSNPTLCAEEIEIFLNDTH